MKREIATLISVNYCLTDEELAEIEKVVEAADPGEWRATPSRSGLARYDGAPFREPEASFHFAVKARSFVPRLLKGLRVVEQAFLQKRAEVAGLRNELAKERTDAQNAALNRSQGRTGPEWEPAQIARLIEVWASLPTGGSQGRASNHNVGSSIGQLLRRWLGGASVGEEVRGDIERMEKWLAEHQKFKAEWEAEQKAAIEKSRDTLAGWIAKLEAGEVPAEMAAQWARKTKAERKKFLAERREAS